MIRTTYSLEGYVNMARWNMKRNFELLKSMAGIFCELLDGKERPGNIPEDG